jgi:peptidoglycan-N-acetylglucosamine deacetylase
MTAAMGPDRKSRRNTAVCVASFVLLLPANPIAAQQDGIRWPNGARAAVSLTYDDGLDVHLDHAVPDLEAVNLRGTFYVWGRAPSFERRLEEWRALVRSGHELGNHSLFHPCVQDTSREHRAFVIPERALEHYTVRRMIDELRIMNTLLYATDNQRSRTYAYPCGDQVAGGESFVDALRPLFVAARALDGKAPVDLKTLDLHRVPSSGASKVTAAKMIDWVNQAIDARTLVVFRFHGVGGGHSINIEREDHQKLLAWLARNHDRIWTAPFVTVTEHVAAERTRLGWTPRWPPAER